MNNIIYSICRKYYDGSGGSKSNFSFNENKYTGNNDVKHLIKISANNIVAWVSKYELSEPGYRITSGCRVYVCDFNMPWNYHKVTWCKSIITTLEWDMHGEYLMIADENGSISVWGYRDHIFNDWICIGSTEFLGEHILAGTFFHSGKRIQLVNNEKKDSPLYYEKFSHTPFAPTVRNVGGTPMDGCFVVSSTGMVAALLIHKDNSGSFLVTSTESLSTTRYRIAVVDIAYGSDGSLIVATSNGSCNVPVKCYKIRFGYVDDKDIRILCQSQAGFFLDDLMTTTNSLTKVSNLKFSLRENPTSILVGVNNGKSSKIQIWDLVDGPYQFGGNWSNDNENSSSGETTGKSWKCRISTMFDTTITCLITSKMQISSKSTMFNIVAAFKDQQKIRVLSSKNLKEESSFYFEQHWESIDSKRTTPNSIADLDITWLGNCFVISDTFGNFYLLQLHAGGLLTVAHAVTQLEYCLVSGLDWWDLTISMKPAMLETVCERFTENFQKQPPAVQQYEHYSFLRIKASICRILGGGGAGGSAAASGKCGDFVYFMTLYSISVAFKSLLRPSDLSSPDKGPGESLAAVLLDSRTDVDSVLLNLEAKEFTVEPSTLQSLQQLIQWVAHLALNILSRVPDHRKSAGYDIVMDQQALNLLRETLLIIRIWGILRESCLPIFIRNVSNFDGISTLFRLISRLLQCCHQQQNEIDENLIDDCCLLQNQVVIPALSSVPMEICDVASPAFFQQTQPIQFVFGHEPENFSYEIVEATLNLDAGLHMTQNSDIIRHVYLGRFPFMLKQCNRCEGKSQVMGNGKTAAIRSWENRWLKSCMCGGKWGYIKSVPPLYSRKSWSSVARSSFNK